MKTYKILLIPIIIAICILPILSFAAGNSFLFVINSKTAIIEKANTHYILMLRNVDPYVTYFSDRPQRNTGLMKINSFVKNWGQTFGKQNASPNVAVEGTQLHSISKDAKDTVNIITLSDPIYMNHILTFQVTNLDKDFPMGQLKNLKHAVLFIDNGYCPCCAVGSCDTM